jgi:hypothetical protein
MLACNNNTDRPFTPEDITALNNTYPKEYEYLVYNHDFYAAGYSDVVSAYNGDPAAMKSHWFNTGLYEGRVASPLFEVDYYRSVHADLRSLTRKQAFDHWSYTGTWEGRAGSSLFDPVYYLANNSDIRASYGATGFMQAYRHWFYTGIGEGRRACATFDVRVYLQKNPDLAAAYGTNYKAATYHWFWVGKKEGRQGI